MSESSGTSSMSDTSCGTKTLPPHLTSSTQHTVTTKVLATAKLKVEVHAPFIDYNSRPNSRNREQSRRYRVSDP